MEQQVVRRIRLAVGLAGLPVGAIAVISLVLMLATRRPIWSDLLVVFSFTYVGLRFVGVAAWAFARHRGHFDRS
jgi:hypothetical protein